MASPFDVLKDIWNRRAEFEPDKTWTPYKAWQATNPMNDPQKYAKSKVQLTPDQLAEVRTGQMAKPNPVVVMPNPLTPNFGAPPAQQVYPASFPQRSAGWPQVFAGGQTPQQTPVPAPVNPVTQAPAGSPIATSGGGAGSKAPLPLTDNRKMARGGNPDQQPYGKYSRGVMLAANPALDQNPALASSPTDQFGPLKAANVTAPLVTPNMQYGLPPEVSPELTAGSQAAAELDAPKNWLQKMASPQGRDFIAMIGQMLAAKGSTYGNEPPASLGYATAARGVTQQALANDWSTRLDANPNAKAPSTLSAESQKQVMDIHEHKAVNEERKYKRQMDMQQIELQKQHLDAQAKKDEADYKFNEEKLKIDKMLADQKINESQADSLYRAAQARALEADIGLTRARTALVGEQVNTERSGGGGGLTAYQTQMEQNRDEAALGRIMAETGITDPWEAMQELNNRKAALQGKPAPSVLPPPRGASPAAGAKIPITPAVIPTILSKLANHPKIADITAMLKANPQFLMAPNNPYYADIMGALK